jgi:hypothetical protein
VPLSQVRMASLVAASFTTLIRYSGAIGSRPASSSAVMSVRHLSISFWYLFRKEVSVRCLSNGSRPRSASRESPTTGTSVAILAPARAGSASTWATRAPVGRYLV